MNENQSTLSEQALRTLAEQVLERSKADETEVLIIGQEARLTRFANNSIHQNVAESDVQVRVRAALGQKVGVASTNDLTPEGLAGVVERATGLARLQAPDPYYAGLPTPDGVTLPTTLGYVPGTAACTPEERAWGVGVICDQAEAAGLTAAGAFSTGEHATVVANSHGLWRYHVGTRAHLSTVVMGPTGSGWSSANHTNAARIDTQAAAAEAVDIARRAQDPGDLEPGVYPVILAPDAVADMMDFLGMISFNGLAVHEGRSFLSTRLGQQVMSSAVSIWDDGLDPNGIPLPFDFEGVPKRRISLVEGGVARAAVWDRRTAAKAGGGRASTGHSLPAPNSMGAVPLNLFMAPGSASQEQMLSGIERGVWVTRFWYTRVVHPLEVMMTGMTRDGTFLIEEGRITRPVRNLRFTQSYLEALNHVSCIGAETRVSADFLGAVRVPALRVERFNFTGATKE